MKYAYTHANLWDGRQDAALCEDVTVLTDGETITAVLERGARTPLGYRKVGLKGKYLMPGLVNLHAHLFGTGKPSKVLGGGGAQKAIIAFAGSKAGRPVIDSMVRSHVTASLHAGVTTIRSSGDFFYSDVRIRDRINAGKLTGPRLIVPGPAITCVGGHGDGTFGVASDDPAELVRLTDRNAAHGVDYIKICVTGGVMDAKVRGEPGEVKMTLEQTKAVCDRAHALGYHVASHTESSKGVRVALEGGVDTIEHGSYLDDALVALFQERGAAYIVTTSPALPLAKLPPEVTKLDELCTYNTNVVFEGMIAGAKTAMENGIPIGLGTDESCPLVTPYNMWREVCWFAEYCGVTNVFALHTATLGNAKIIGLDSVTGSIEPGKSADMIVLPRSPLDDLTALRDVEMVVARGKLLRRPKVKRSARIDAWLDTLD